MKSIKLSIHNGIGDIVKLFPFVNELIKYFEITIQTVEYNHSLITYFFKDKIKLERWENHWYHNNDERYDYVINLNHLYKFNDVCTWQDFVKYLPMGIHPVICYMFLLNGLKKEEFLPKEFSPSYNLTTSKTLNDHILIFTKSTAGNRTLNKEFVNKIKSKYKDKPNVIIDPEYDAKIWLAKSIDECKFVLTTDNGPLHISEACKTPYHALLTVNSYNKFMKYYKYGTFSYPDIDCSPCNFHQNYCLEFGEKNYKCQDKFNIKDIFKIIDKNL